MQYSEVAGYFVLIWHTSIEHKTSIMLIADFFGLRPYDQHDVLCGPPVQSSLYDAYTGQSASVYACSDTAGRLTKLHSCVSLQC